MNLCLKLLLHLLYVIYYCTKSNFLPLLFSWLQANVPTNVTVIKLVVKILLGKIQNLLFF